MNFKCEEFVLPRQNYNFPDNWKLEIDLDVLKIHFILLQNVLEVKGKNYLGNILKEGVRFFLARVFQLIVS